MNIRIKYGDTHRTINLVIEEDCGGDAHPFDLGEVTGIVLRIVLDSETTIERTFTKGDDEGECYYRPTSEADFDGEAFEMGGRYECELWLTFEDGSTAPVPSVGTNWLYIDRSIAAPA